MEEGVRRPFKICDSQRNKLKGVVVRNLEELRQVADEKFSVGKKCRVFVDRDGTEIEDDDYLSFVKDDSKLMVATNADNWNAEGTLSDTAALHRHQSIPVSCESNESLEVDLTDAGDGIRPELVRKIKVDSAFFVSLSEEDLLEIVRVGVERFADVLGQGALEAQHYQEVCQREIDKRREYKEATALLRLYHKSQENSDDAGTFVRVKRHRTP